MPDPLPAARGPAAVSAGGRRAWLGLLTRRHGGRPRGNAVLDLFAALAAFALVHAAWLGDLDLSTDRTIVMCAALALLSLGLSAGGLYRADAQRGLHEDLARLVVCWGLALAGVGLFAFLTKLGEDVSRVWVGTSMLLVLVWLASSRVARGLYLASAAAGQRRDVVVVGAGEGARLALERLDAAGRTGYRVAGVFADRDVAPDSLPGERSTLGRIDAVGAFVEARRHAGRPVAEVWIALPLHRQKSIRRIMEALGDSSADVCLVPEGFGLRLLSAPVVRVGDLRVVNVSEVRLPARAELFKRAFDCAVAGAAVAALGPLMLGIALAVRLESPGPALFRQRRYGIDGREIEVWKFRSMGVQENGAEVRQAVRGDARVTRVGRFIRRTSLDELPQFLNVLQGSMSVVGPRPHAVVHNEQYRRLIRGYMSRHKIKPGITGWAQVNGWRGETDTLEKMERRVHLDLEYIRNWSPWLDARIVLLTLTRGLGGGHVY